MIHENEQKARSIRNRHWSIFSSSATAARSLFSQKDPLPPKQINPMNSEDMKLVCFKRHDVSRHPLQGERARSKSASGLDDLSQLHDLAHRSNLVCA
jgi:hypothetical protein